MEVTYNSDYFAEGEIRDTIKKAIKDLNDQKEKKFGRLKLCDVEKQIMELPVMSLRVKLQHADLKFL